MNDQEMRSTFETAIAAFGDPARRDRYFETLYAEDVVLHGYAPEPLRGTPTVEAFYAPLFDAFPDCRVDHPRNVRARSDGFGTAPLSQPYPVS